MDLRQIKRDIDDLARRSRKIDYAFGPTEYISLFDKLVDQIDRLQESVEAKDRQIKELEKDFKSRLKTQDEKISSLSSTVNKVRAKTQSYR